ncbi:hypothetical protein OSH11_21685 [Kaistia dalseonensis]|uniref:DUF1834 family protein n=1 Tax=Kaistia dalseonensis TaxID=410840 RepID=A0ABU0HEM7_9HYPH|nr:hypothetical protein [Kaistia dalseonensis]MCX5497324.1 hypothetical protein [Kaistia dalseonensis]MDQ0439961.1 hypothetical protein [Kaistia dalseonensis]
MTGEIDIVSQLARSVETLLRERFPENRWTIEHVPTPMTIEEFKRLLGVTPWIGIGWQAIEPGATAGRRTPVTIKMQATICLKNEGRSGRLLGDSAAAGLYPAMELARLTLQGRTIADFGTISVTRAGQAYADGYGSLAVAIGVIDFEVPAVLATPLGAGDVSPGFAVLATDWDFAPGEGSPADDPTDIIEPGEPA